MMKKCGNANKNKIKSYKKPRLIKYSKIKTIQASASSLGSASGSPYV
jgi:hypothetical protein